MADMHTDTETHITDAAVTEGGAYDVIRKRLLTQGQNLQQQTDALNQERLEEFGSADMSIVARTRVRTDNNCIARDMVQVGKYLLFGYNVFIGLKKETLVDDVFALFEIKEDDTGYDIEARTPEHHFLQDKRFVSDFDELYRYYKHTRLIELTVKDGKLLAGFQIGERLTDLRVFRWAISADGHTIDYIDNRGERDIRLPPAFDFEWTETTRDDVQQGIHTHINILDTLFIYVQQGELSIRIENNTEAGLTIDKAAVEDKTQSLNDGDFLYARTGDLILLKIRPYREQVWRCLIYNTVTEAIVRIDKMGESCVQLPEDHGIIFPGGYYLQNGDHKTFEEDTAGFSFKRMIRSPNGEDVCYVFYHPSTGAMGLFAYNLINKKLLNPVMGHGYALREDGLLTMFTAEEEATRVHPMQIWQTPYQSKEFAATQPASQTFLGKIGNAELVRGISDLYSIGRMIAHATVSQRLYEALSKEAGRLFDNHYWLTEGPLTGINETVHQIISTAELVIDEFIKVQHIQARSASLMAQAEADQVSLLQSVQSENFKTAEDHVNGLAAIRAQRGHLMTLQQQRYIDSQRINSMEKALVTAEADTCQATVEFLSNEDALMPYFDKIAELDIAIEQAETIALLTPLIEQLENTASGLTLLSDVISTLTLTDASSQASIIEAISSVYAQLNQSKANAQHKQTALGSSEATAQFSAQLALFAQSMTHALGLATSPENCDEQLSRLLVQLDELESQFGRFDNFLSTIIDKREQVHEAFDTHKQQLLDARQREAQSINDAAVRVLASIEKRSMKQTDAEQLNTYFASDAMVLRTRKLIADLRDLDANIKADAIEAKFVAIKEQALRALRDKTDIYEAGGQIIKLGPRHRFTVNTQTLDLTIIPRDGDLFIHLIGTDYYERIDHPELVSLKDYWDMTLISETPNLYRAEFLAGSIMDAAKQAQSSFDTEHLYRTLTDPDALTKLVRDYSASRYKEGYQKGIHDADAVVILQAVLPAMAQADLLAFDPESRALAQIFWAHRQTHQDKNHTGTDDKTWVERARSAQQLHDCLNSSDAITLLVNDVQSALEDFLQAHPIAIKATGLGHCADYLVAELARPDLAFVASQYASQLVDTLKQSLPADNLDTLKRALNSLKQSPEQRWLLLDAWFHACVKQHNLTALERFIPEAIALMDTENQLEKRPITIDTELTLTGLMGNHPRLHDRGLTCSLDDFLQRFRHHQSVVIPAYQDYLRIRQAIAQSERQKLRLDEFKARPLSSFVRNQLINDAYLPLIGDNLAKQMGTAGEGKRTDLMGLLMMISPPGYGKTTLMEYIANRLGLIFVKINCPSIGHEAVSLDPAQAPHATAAEELQKLNLALEMGNNVMLYLDDIQHTSAEFLQQFIALCDGTRRIDGIWKGNAKTYDMRGRKFCIVMAGNPYTETGEAFKVPDMLANRADIYNLGDISFGMEKQFALSYIENCLTSNKVLAPLALRDADDIYQLVESAQTGNNVTSTLSHPYSLAEINEITNILSRLFVIQDVILKVNQAYIASAAQDDKFRTEPPFKLQGSYRNMNKMAEKISAVMTHDELLQMITDHYKGEAQLLTAGAEANLLKLAALRGNMTDEQNQRWQAIQDDFLRNKAMGGDDSDTGTKIVAQLADLVTSLDKLQTLAREATSKPRTPEQPSYRLQTDEALKIDTQSLQELAAVLNTQPTATQPPAALHLASTSIETIGKMLASYQPAVNVVNQPVPGMDKVLTVLAETIEHSIFPLVKSMDKKLDIDLKTHERMSTISDQLRQLEAAYPPKKTL